MLLSILLLFERSKPETVPCEIRERTGVRRFVSEASKKGDKTKGVKGLEIFARVLFALLEIQQETDPVRCMRR